MIKYQRNLKYNPEKLHPRNVDRLSVDLVPTGSTVLEIGCATGFLGKYLKESKNCRVTGVDIRREEAMEAKKYLDEVLTGDMGNLKFVNSIGKKYDVILAQAVIQQIIEPKDALRMWKKLLKKNGVLIISASNIAHWTTRKELFFGRFDYKQYGLLDEDHLIFYTIDSFKNLIEESGYKVENFKFDDVGGGYPKLSMFMSKLFPGLFTYQMMILAKLK